MKKMLICCAVLAALSFSALATGPAPNNTASLRSLGSPILSVGQNPVQVSAQDLTPVPTVIVGLRGGTVKVALSERLQTIPTGLKWLGSVDLDSFEGVQAGNLAPVAGFELLKNWSWQATSTLTLFPTVGFAWTGYVQGSRPNVGVVLGLGAKF